MTAGPAAARLAGRTMFVKTQSSDSTLLAAWVLVALAPCTVFQYRTVASAGNLQSILLASDDLNG